MALTAHDTAMIQRYTYNLINLLRVGLFWHCSDVIGLIWRLKSQVNNPVNNQNFTLLILWEKKPPVTGGPLHRACNTKSVSVSWNHKHLFAFQYFFYTGIVQHYSPQRIWQSHSRPTTTTTHDKKLYQLLNFNYIIVVSVNINLVWVHQQDRF